MSSQIAVQVRTARMQAQVYNQWCTCACHRRRKIRSPRFLDSFLGTLILGYTAIPMLTPSCNESSCRSRTSLTTSLTYYFPKWGLRKAVSLAFINGLELVASLKMPRLVDPNAKIFDVCSRGEVEEIKSLFQRGEASPNDMMGNTGWSLLYRRRNHNSLASMLLEAGADTYSYDKWDRNAVNRAVKMDRLGFLKLLLKSRQSEGRLVFKELQTILREQKVSYAGPGSQILQLLINARLSIRVLSVEEWKSLETEVCEQLAAKRWYHLDTKREKMQVLFLWKEFIEGLMERGGYGPSEQWEEKFEIMIKYVKDDLFASRDSWSKEGLDEKWPDEDGLAIERAIEDSDEGEVDFEDALEFHVEQP